MIPVAFRNRVATLRQLPLAPMAAAIASVLFLIRTLAAQWPHGFYAGYPDTDSFLEVSARGPLNGRFWFGERPIVLPVFAWLLGGNQTLIVLVQSLVYLAAFWWAVYVATRVLRHRAARILGVVMLLSVAVQPRFALWNTFVLSESLSISTGVAMVATWVYFVHAPNVRRATWATAITVVWALVRDSNVAVVMVVMAPMALVAARRWRPGAPEIARRLRFGALAMLVAALFASAAQTVSHRNQYSTLSLIGQKVLPSQELTDLYTSFGMPLDDAVRERTGRSVYDDDLKTLISPDLAELRSWARSRGQMVYLVSIVVKSPQYVGDVWDALPSMLSQSFNAYDGFHVSQHLPESLPLGLDGPRDQPDIALWFGGAFAALLAMSLSLSRRRLSAGLMVLFVGVLVDLYISWLGDTLEVHRHIVCAVPRLGVVLAFIAAVGVDAAIDVVRRYRQDSRA